MPDPVGGVAAVTAEAFVYAYPMLFNYKTLHEQAVDEASPMFVGGFGTFRHYPHPYTPDDKDIVTPNNDTPYSWAWLDLRAEPWVLSVPEVPENRYVVFQWFDLFTYNFAYVGVLTTGRAAGHYLFAGPGWDGAVPDGIDRVFRAESDFIGCLGRTGLEGPDDVPNVQALQAEYRLAPLSAFAGTPAPAPAPPVAWPAWDESGALSHDFIVYLNFLLGHTLPVHPSEVELMARFATVGIGPGVPFDAAALDAETRAAIDAGVAEGIKQLEAAESELHTSIGAAGTRDQVESYLARAAVAAKGIYANSPEEAIYIGWIADQDRHPLSGQHRYEVRFPAGALPPVELFWSITMYDLPARLLVANPIDRYSIGDRTPDLVTADDGSLTLYVQREQPAHPQQAANWLPAPPGPFTCIFRLYGPKPAILDGTWQQPPMTRID